MQDQEENCTNRSNKVWKAAPKNLYIQASKGMLYLNWTLRLYLFLWYCNLQETHFHTVIVCGFPDFPRHCIAKELIQVLDSIGLIIRRNAMFFFCAIPWDFLLCIHLLLPTNLSLPSLVLHRSILCFCPKLHNWSIIDFVIPHIHFNNEEM